MTVPSRILHAMAYRSEYRYSSMLMKKYLSNAAEAIPEALSSDDFNERFCSKVIEDALKNAYPRTVPANKMMVRFLPPSPTHGCSVGSMCNSSDSQEPAGTFCSVLLTPHSLLPPSSSLSPGRTSSLLCTR